MTDHVHQDHTLQAALSASRAADPQNEHEPEAEDTGDTETPAVAARGSVLDPWSESYAPVVRAADASPPTEYDRLYAFLLSLPGEGTRRIIGQLSPTEKKQCGRIVINERKRRKVNKLLLHAALQVATGSSYSTAFGQTQVSWNTSERGVAAPHFIAPSISLLRQMAPDDCFPAHAVASPTTPPFCTNEFARLLALIIDGGAEIRRSLLLTGQDLSRDELDRGVDRDAVWGDLISPKFNDRSVVVSLNLGGRVDGVDAAAAPLAERSGLKLLSAYNKTKSVFTKAYRDWTVSGSNDTDKIGDFVSTQRASGEPSEEGKRALLMFYALKCGTPEEDADLLEFTLKTCARGVAYDDDEQTLQENRRRQAGGSSRRRQRIEDAEAATLAEGNAILREGISAVVQSLSARPNRYDASNAKRAKDVASLTKDLVSLHDLLEASQTAGKPVEIVRRIERSIAATTRSLDSIECQIDNEEC